MRALPDFRLTSLFLDMLAAEQGAGDNTLQAYRRDLADFSRFLARTGRSFADADTQAVAGALPAMRFLPAEAGGHRVRQLVEAPFTFSLRP